MPHMKLRQRLNNVQSRSLANERQSRLLGAMLVAAAAMFAAGVSLPILETRFLLSSEQHSLIGVVFGLLDARDFFLAIVITVFSIVLPFAKLFVLAIVYKGPVGIVSPRLRWLLEAVSKWAMLDVLLVALFIFSLKSAPFADAFTMPGVYLFTLAAILSHYICGRILMALRNQTALIETQG